jgi:hypothetical protein
MGYRRNTDEGLRHSERRSLSTEGEEETDHYFRQFVRSHSLQAIQDLYWANIFKYFHREAVSCEEAYQGIRTTGENDGLPVLKRFIFFGYFTEQSDDDMGWFLKATDLKHEFGEIIEDVVGDILNGQVDLSSAYFGGIPWWYTSLPNTNHCQILLFDCFLGKPMKFSLDVNLSY